MKRRTGLKVAGYVVLVLSAMGAGTQMERGQYKNAMSGVAASIALAIAMEGLNK